MSARYAFFVLAAIVSAGVPAQSQTHVTIHAALVRSGPPDPFPLAYEPVMGIGIGAGVDRVVARLGPLAPRAGLDLGLTAAGRKDVLVTEDFRQTIYVRPLYLTAAPTFALGLAAGPVRPYVLGGSVAGVKLAERTSGRDDVTGESIGSATTDDFPDLVSGLAAGVGVHVPDAFPLGGLRVEARASSLGGLNAPSRYTDQSAFELRAVLAL